MELGDQVERALRAVGVTSERVTFILGRPCRCEGRKEALNRLSRWARRVLAGKTERALDYLHEIVNF